MNVTVNSSVKKCDTQHDLRAGIVDRFQQHPGISVFLLSAKAGGSCFPFSPPLPSLCCFLPPDARSLPALAHARVVSQVLASISSLPAGSSLSTSPGIPLMTPKRGQGPPSLVLIVTWRTLTVH